MKCKCIGYLLYLPPTPKEKETKRKKKVKIVSISTYKKRTFI